MRKENAPRTDRSLFLVDAGLIVWVVMLALAASTEVSINQPHAKIIQARNAVSSPFVLSFNDRWQSLHPVARPTGYWLTPGPQGHAVERVVETPT